jgi:two-component system, chemotaxis family, protein-glutamate methylesterase/glutaminase
MNRIVVIGSSTGGPTALESIFTNLPLDFSVPIIVAQHLTKPFTKELAERLQSICPDTILVQEAKNGQAVDSQNAYIIPGDSHFFITDPLHKLTLIPADDLPKPSVDMGFTSVAEHYGQGTVAVVLSGFGSDGVIGAKAVKQVFGRVLVQDEMTSTIYGMPKAVSDAGLADEVLPLNKIVPRLVELVTNKHVKY